MGEEEGMPSGLLSLRRQNGARPRVLGQVPGGRGSRRDAGEGGLGACMERRGGNLPSHCCQFSPGKEAGSSVGWGVGWV